jgi:hypothetical protein
MLSGGNNTVYFKNHTQYKHIVQPKYCGTYSYQCALNDLNKKKSPPAFLKCKVDMGDQFYLTDPTEKVPHFITTEAEVIFLSQKEPYETSSMCVNYRLLFFLVKDIEQNYFLFKRILRYKIPTYGTQTPKCDQLI